ncbi:Dabb family protein [Chryseobacterium potabilaquae]|nr:Dabb family protein [Chryseobacterium potabilaquae]
MKKNNLKNTTKNIIKSFMIGLIFIGLMSTISCNNNNDDMQVPQSMKTERIEHLVLFKFKPTVTEQQRQEVVNRFMALRNSLKDGKTYLKVEYGFQNSMEDVKGNYDVGFRVTFNSLEDRDYYVGKIDGQPTPAAFDPMHDDFKNFVGPFLDVDDPATGGVLVFDYKSNEGGTGSVPETGYRLDHWVLFKFKPGISEAQKQEVVNRFLDLKNGKKDGKTYIPFIEFGYQNSKEGVARGYDIAFRASFTSKADRDYYVGKPFLNDPGTFDPLHDAFKNFVGSFIDIDPQPTKGVLVYDYEVKKQ